MKKFKIGLPGLWCFLILCFALTAMDLGARVNRGAAVPDQDLPGALKGMEIKDSFIPSSNKLVGVIHDLNGTVVVIHRATREAYFGRSGDAVFENDGLSTLADSRCRIRFSNDDVVTMAQDSRFAVEEYVNQRKEGKKRSLFSMVKGKAMFYSMRLFLYKDTRFNLKTPTAVVGVSGTKFGAHVYYLEPEKRADSGNALSTYMAKAQPRENGRPVTVVANGDGQVDVNGILLNPGETFNTIDNVKKYDPTVMADIQYAARMRQEGEKIGEGVKAEGEELVMDTGEETTLRSGADNAENLTDFTSLETGTKTEEKKHGYFSAFLKYNNGEVRDAFASNSLQHTDPMDDVYAYGAVNPSNYYLADEVSNGDEVDARGEVYLDPPGSSSDPLNIEGLRTYLGHYNYLQWGYHSAKTLPELNIGGTVYELINKFWFVEGYPTKIGQLAALSGDYTYSGVVRGTYYPSNADMEGTYSSSVNFGSSSIQDFNLNASGGGHTVGFVQAGSSTVDSSGQFIISGGTFRVDGGAVSDWDVNGAHFGPGAAEQAGAWTVVSDTSDFGAWGVFAGEK
ncbi:MAG TPA: FecR family protein [Anaerolineae bacterium]|nr:FecR family protein [Anaerolineae bacterium]